MSKHLDDIEASTKAFLLADNRRRLAFDGYYERLKETINGNIEITPDDALLLLIHHLFLWPHVSQLFGWASDNRITSLLDETVERLRSIK